MKPVLLEESQRKKLLKASGASLDSIYSYQNLNLLTAVYDEGKKFYLTCLYFLSTSISQGEEDEYRFALISSLGTVHTLSCTRKGGEYMGIHSLIPGISGEDVLRAVRAYDDSIFQRREMEKAEKKRLGADGSYFAKWYMEQQGYKKTEYTAEKKTKRKSPVGLILGLCLLAVAGFLLVLSIQNLIW